MSIRGPLQRRPWLVVAIGASIATSVLVVAARPSFGSAGVSQVGRPTVFSASSTTQAKTAVPAGTSAGDVVISFVETSARSTVSCPAGWRVVSTSKNVPLTQLITCLTVSSTKQVSPVVSVRPAAATTMTTVAFSGVNATNPIVASGHAANMLAPSLHLPAPASTVVYAAGWTDPTRTTPAIYAPDGFVGLGAVSGGTSHLGVAKLVGSYASSTPAGAFYASKNPPFPATSVVALRAVGITSARKASPSTVSTTPSTSTTTTAPPTTTAPTTTAPTTPPTTAPKATPTTAPPATTIPPSAPTGVSAVWSTASATGSWTAPNNYIVNNDVWNTNEAGPQSMSVYAYNHWTVSSNQPALASDPGSVKTYPDTQYFVNKTASQLSNVTSSFNLTGPVGAGNEWDATFDTWWGNWADELMIFTNWTGQAIPPGPATLVNLGGVNFYAWHSSGFTAFSMQTPEAAGSINLLPVFQYAVSRGWISTTEQLGALEYGVEVSSTNGAQSFALNNYSLTAS